LDQRIGVRPLSAQQLRQPGNPGGTIYRILQARLVVPTDQLQAIGRVLLTGRLDIERTTDETGEPAAVH